MTQPTTNSLIQSVVTLLTEAYAGPPNPNETWFVDNQPGAGILPLLDSVTAEEASKSADSSGDKGTTIAANAEHLRWSVANANSAMRGEPFNPNWSESWQLIEADPTEWDRLRAALRSEFEALCDGLQKFPEIPDQYILGVLALIPHAAFHLGLMRQMIERVRA